MIIPFLLHALLALLLVGNKKDLWEGREVSEEEGQEYADR
jgi:hypothetical protein